MDYGLIGYVGLTIVNIIVCVMAVRLERKDFNSGHLFGFYKGFDAGWNECEKCFEADVDAEFDDVFSEEEPEAV